MRYVLKDYDSKYFAVNLNVTDRNTLKWDDSHGTGALLFRCPFGEHPFDKIEELLACIRNIPLTDGVFSEFSFEERNYGVRYLNPTQIIKHGGCDNAPVMCSIMLLACSIEGDTLCVYPPQSEKTEKQQYIDRPLQIVITYSEEVLRTKKLFKVTETPTGFYILDTDCIGDALGRIGYTDGDIYYSVDGIRIPITRGMIDREVYVKADEAPMLTTSRLGLEVIMEKVHS